MPVKWMILNRELGPDRQEHVECLFFHVISPPITIGGNAHAETPSTELPKPVLDNNLLTAGELAAFDNGQAVWRHRIVERDKDEGTAAMKAKIDTEWAKAEARETRAFQRRYAHYGHRDTDPI
jgi:hypothetical protein